MSRWGPVILLGTILCSPWRFLGLRTSGRIRASWAFANQASAAERLPAPQAAEGGYKGWYTCPYSVNTGGSPTLLGSSMYQAVELHFVQPSAQKWQAGTNTWDMHQSTNKNGGFNWQNCGLSVSLAVSTQLGGFNSLTKSHHHHHHYHHRHRHRTNEARNLLLTTALKVHKYVVSTRL